MKFWESLAPPLAAGIVFLLAIIISLSVLPRTSYGQSPSQLSEAEQLVEKAFALMDAAKYASANTYIKEAASIYVVSEKPVMVAYCYNHLSSNNRLMFNLDIARQQAQKALSLLIDLHLNDPTERIRAYTNLGLISVLKANYDQSMRYLSKASSLLNDDAVSPTLKMVVIGSLGYLYDDLGKYEKALSYYNRALDILLDQPDPPKFRLAKLYNNIGVAYTNKGLYERARHYYQLELRMNLSVKGKDHPDVAGTYLNIGNSYFRSGDVGEALLYFQRAYRTIIAAYGKQHAMTVLALNSLAKCEMNLGNYRQAINYLNNAVTIKKKLVGADHPELAISYQSIGKAYAEMGNWQRAGNYYKKALSIRKKSLRPDHPDLAVAYNNLANFYLEKEEYSKALKSLKQAEDILLASVGSKHPSLAETYAAMGRAFMAKKDITSGISLFQKALSVVAPAFNGIKANENPKPASIEYPAKAVQVLLHKAQSLHRLSQRMGELSMLKASVLTYMTLSKLFDHMQWGYMQLSSKLALGKRSHKIYEQAIEAAYRMYEATNNTSYFQVIFYFSEKSKGRVLREAVAHTNAKQFVNIPDTILQHEKQLHYKLRKVKQQLYESFSDKNSGSFLVDQLKDSLFVLNRQLAAFVRNLEQQFPKYHRLKYSSKFPSVYKIQQRLERQNSIILEYFYGNETLFAIVITPERMWVEPLEFDPGLRNQISKFTNAIISRNDTYQNLGYRLYKRLIKPVQAYIKSAGSLLIVPGGPLHLLPFEALLKQKVTDDFSNFQTFPYLIKGYNISYATSIALNAAMANDGDPEFEKQFIGFAPVFSQKGNWKEQNAALGNKNWQMLSFSKFEVNRIAALFKEESSFWDFLPWKDVRAARVFLKNEATEERFKSSRFQNARYIHLATHAFLAGDVRPRSGIVFYQNEDTGNDDILYTNEIYNLQLHTQLVVLSACKTGVGSIVKGEGLMGLSRAFQYAGANNLIVSLWNIGDRSTAALMVSFYKFLQKGYSMPRALSQAKRTMINNRRYAHPRYWASFKLIGNSRQ